MISILLDEMIRDEMRNRNQNVDAVVIEAIAFC